MKKILSLLLSILLMLSFAACGKNDENKGKDKASSGNSNGQNDSQKADSFKPEKLFGLITVDNYEIEEDEPYVYEEGKLESIAKDYTLKGTCEYTAERKLKLESTEIEFRKTTVKELIADGWEITGGNSADDLVSEKISTNAAIKNKDGKTAVIVAANKTDSAEAPFSECVIISVTVDYSKGYTAEIVCGELNISSTLEYEDVLNAFGEPKSIVVTEWYKDKAYTYSNANLIYSQKIVEENRTIHNEFRIECVDDGETIKVERFEYSF